LEDLEAESLEYKTVEEFLVYLKKKFGRENDETMKVTELKRIEQKNRIMKEFIQKFRKVVRRSRYEGRLLAKEFKQEINE